MYDKLTAPDIDLERERFDNPREVHSVFLSPNCAKTVSF
jgi:hypothetical protein